MQLTRPKTNFCDWMKERVDIEYTKDLSVIGGLIHVCLRDDSPFTDKRKRKLRKFLVAKMDQRNYDYVNGNGSKWDGRSWKWYYKIYDEYKKAGGKS